MSVIEGGALPPGFAPSVWKDTAPMGHQSADPKTRTVMHCVLKVGLVFQLPLQFYVKIDKSVFTCFINKT